MIRFSDPKIPSIRLGEGLEAVRVQRSCRVMDWRYRLSASHSISLDQYARSGGCSGNPIEEEKAF